MDTACREPKEFRETPPKIPIYTVSQKKRASNIIADAQCFSVCHSTIATTV